VSTDHDNPFHAALNQLLSASYFASPEEVAPIFKAISALADRYHDQIQARRREQAALYTERAMAERGKRRS
jgi:hypothetical protein